MQQFFSDNFSVILVLIGLAIALTIFVFRRRLFERGYRKGEAANPQKVKRQNRPDSWSRSHH